MGLAEYRRKRTFDVTPEPAGTKPRAGTGRSYCIQKHAASRLHYDFRLEMEGVLRSWAVPKGPSLDPADKRLAAHVEDHPLEYGGFEGIIPKGQYGGGTVMLWDRGEWVPDGDPVAMYRKGRLKFRLAGEKLRGAWTLVRMNGPGHADGKEWLLIKERDDEALPGQGTKLVDDRPASVKTERTLAEIAAATGSVWQSKPARRRAAPKRAAGRAAKSAPTKPRAAPIDLSAIDGARKAPFPREVEPELATLADTAPAGADWLHEIKFDGYRIVCLVKDGRARLTSRRGNDWTSRMPALAAAAAKLPVREAVLDGEAVLVEPDGRSSFQALQNALSADRTDDIVYFAFDLLHLDGYDLRGVPLLERKRVLAGLLGRAEPGGPIHYSDHVQGSGGEFLQHACKLAVEGAVCKRADSLYVPGRGRDWLKVKCIHGQEVVIVGFTEPSGGRTGFGALLVGVHDAKGRLLFAGKVGTGFTNASLADLRGKLVAIEAGKPAVVDAPRGGAAAGVHWVKPVLVAEVSFSEWTRDGRLRHPSFKGLRADKPASQIVRERPSLVGSQSAAPAVSPTETNSTSDASPKRATRRSAAARAPTARASSSPVVAGVTLSHPERVLYPGQGVTKLELARYYETIAEWILPHVSGRPLTLVRCPQGLAGKSFFQKHVTESTPSEIHPVSIVEGTGVGSEPAQYMEIDSLEGLVSLAQMCALELHLWGARSEDHEHPDRLVFDFDPDPSVGWPRVAQAAIEVRDRLSDLGLVSFVKTTGGKGLHVVVPVTGGLGWDDAKAFTRAVADAMVTDAPDRYTANMSKARRTGRIFIDYLRNGRGATAIAPYSTRARPGAPVAMPVAWDELTPKLRPDSYDIRNVAARLARRRADPWKEIASVRQRISAAARKKLGLS